MLKLKRILLPVDYPNTSLSIIHQAATLAQHFQSEIILLHIVTALSHAAGVPEGGAELARWDLLAEIVRGAKKKHDESLETKLRGLTVRRMLVRGAAARAIVETAEEKKADLIMMPPYGQTFDQFLLGSVAAKELPRIECPVWTSAHVEESRVQEFAIRHVLCAVDFNQHDRKTVSWAAQIADEFGARLTLAHVTATVEFWGPGGTYANKQWKEALVGDAALHIAELQQAMGIETGVFIGSGEAPKVLSQAAKQTKADLLVTGCHPYGGRLRTHGYATMCAVPIPVLSV
ncbi:MAG: universal stress protein [Candidatus Acidiferrum sp.]